MLTLTYAAVLDQVRGITWSAQRRSRSVVAGPHSSRLLGTSAEFVEYRAYRQGDDPGRIDWKLLARTNRVYIRLSQERTLLPTVFVVDASASLRFPTPSLAKWELARQLTVGLAAIARHAGDPVGLVIASPEGLRAVAPSARRSILDEMMRALDLIPARSPALGMATRQAMRHGGRVAIVSDFLDEADDVLAAGRMFVAGGGELYALHVVDRGELAPDPTKLLVEDPESAAVRRPLSRATRTAYLERFGAWRAELARRWRNAGAHYTMLVTEQEPLRRSVRRITTHTGSSEDTAGAVAHTAGAGSK